MNEQGNREELCGTVEHITFHNEENGFTVLSLNTGFEISTVVGSFPTVNEGEQLRLIGNWMDHATFGPQFRAESCERMMPTTTAAIFRFLASGAVRGVGLATARALVDTFGAQTLEIIEKEPERLCVIRGINSRRAARLSEEFKQLFGVREVMLFLGEYGVTPNEAMRVWKVWGNQTVERIKSNPYLLCTEGIGIGFDRADEIARAMNCPMDDEMRIRAGTVHVLKHNAAIGHTCLPEDQLVLTTARMLGVEPEQVQSGVAQLVADTTLVQETLLRTGGMRSFLFLPALHRAETYAAGRLHMMMQFPPPGYFDIADDLLHVEEELHIHYEARQREAIEKALAQGLLILTGGPGTGKTTTLNAIIRLMEWKGLRVALAAPTGRAAKRMSEVTGKEAKTLHRLLEVEWDKSDHPVFARNEKNLLECDALIVDELSMVDIALFASLLRALPLGCRLVLVGDSDQLPSVGPGDVLHDLIDSGLVPTVQLQEVFRQSMQSLIVTGAHRIVRGEMPDLTVHNSDFFFLPEANRERLQQTIVDLCKRRLPNRYGYSPMTDIQVLCPGRKGELGVIELNKQLQAAINPPDAAKAEVTVMGKLLRTGDKVMQMKNDYDISWVKDDGTLGTGIFNGDVGILQSIHRAADQVLIRFEDRVATYSVEMLENVELAYAATVHKSQGNEFEAVIMPMFPGPPQLYYRNLLYTAVTRAKNLLILVGRADVIAQMVENDRKTKRYSGLRNFLCQEVAPHEEGEEA